MEMENNEPPAQALVSNSKYTKRVVLKTVLQDRSDGGLGLIGHKVVVGGWVKSAKEIRKDPLLYAVQASSSSSSSSGKGNIGNGNIGNVKGRVNCTEILHIPMPFVRSLLKAFGISHEHKHQGVAAVDVDRQHHGLPSPALILQLTDGSCVASLQVLVESSLGVPGHIVLTGTCILVEGIVQKATSSGSVGPGKHLIQVKAENVLHLGGVDPERYPLSKKLVPFDTLRDWAHFRPRTTTVASITRISNALTHATHAFFQNNGFLHVQVPIITTTDTDCQGFGNHLQFQVTAAASTSRLVGEISDIDALKASIKEKSVRVEELKRTDSNKEALIQDLKRANDLAAQLEADKRAGNTNKRVSMRCFEDDFFGCQAYLTVSGRLHLGSYACALGNVYSFGPRFNFKAAKLQLQAAEVWKVEAEMAFAELDESVNCAIDYLKFLCKWLVDNCCEDLKFVLKRIDKAVVDRLQSLASADFVHLSYEQAVDALKQVTTKQFHAQVKCGTPLSEEHESFLAEEIYKKPVVICNHPKEMKPFYVRMNDDGMTVAAFDILVPKVGALIRGSQNEERLNVLTSRIRELGLASDQYEWYVDLCRHGTVKHAGFTLGFDTMLLLATGITNVHNVIPFPITYAKASH